jgi:hypothetical protein
MGNGDVSKCRAVSKMCTVVCKILHFNSGRMSFAICMMSKMFEEMGTTLNHLPMDISNGLRQLLFMM